MKNRIRVRDPLERIIADALERINVAYIHELMDSEATSGPDFYLPDLDLYIEVKAFDAGDRTVRQLKGRTNILLVQGRDAAIGLASLLTGQIPGRAPGPAPRGTSGAETKK